MNLHITNTLHNFASQNRIGEVKQRAFAPQFKTTHITNIHHQKQVETMSKTTTISHQETQTRNETAMVTFKHKNPLQSREEELEAERMLENLLEICQAEKFNDESITNMVRRACGLHTQQDNDTLKDRIEEFMSLNGFFGTATIQTINI